MNTDRCLSSLLSIFYSEETVSDDSYTFSASGLYFAPPHGAHESYIEYIRSLPIDPLPEVFGLHENADISRQQAETQQLFDNVLITLPRTSGGGGVSTQDQIKQMAADILEKVAAPFDNEAIGRQFPIVYHESMNTVLKQELIRFNNLIRQIRSSLINLDKAVKGLVVMNSELEEGFDSMLIVRIPSMWAAKSYPSLKKLGGYVADLAVRLSFLQTWIDNRQAPAASWISGFYFPQSFLTAVNQNYARKYQIPIDLIGFQFRICETENGKDVEEKPEDGAFIYGLFFEGARWDRNNSAINESKPKVLFDSIPVIELVPTKMDEIDRSGTYKCPVYKTSARKGTLSTTGHSTNFVLWIDFPSN